MKEAQKTRRRYRPLDRFRASMRADKRRMIWGDAAPPEPEPVPGRARRWDLRKVVLASVPVAILAGAAGLAGGLATDWQFARVPPSAPAAAPAAVLPDPLAPLPGDLQARLTAPVPELPAALKLTFAGSPGDLCAELAMLGLPNSGWTVAPFRPDRWQCSSDLVSVGAPDVDREPTTLFFLLRGTAERVDYLRLKLNAANPRTAAEGRSMARKVLDALSRRYAWEFPPAVLRAISDMRGLELTERGVRFEVATEDPGLTGDPLARDRLNVIIEFSPPDHIRPTRFEATAGTPPAAAGAALAPQDAAATRAAREGLGDGLGDGPGDGLGDGLGGGPVQAFGPIEFRPLVAFPPEGGAGPEPAADAGLPPLDTAYPPLVGITPDGSEPPSPTDGSALVSPPAAE
ncbi:hypothetical protein GWI72_09110 [Microvirga tunisiensis]|uniref:Uncharacterized protein n=1 Tax=Pannonibacter tanglangensis TaxID=2750084 RepID=A0A7X5F2T6_9HYPH|nr:DUF6030 family protein [Pannonibacter sp. XCT-53]NBN78424.1 hypothetical protein [Pannonibacter sp. XCT-53]